MTPPALTHLLAVAGGGALGAAARHLVGLVAGRPTAGGMPWGTLVINVVGSFVLGWFVRWADVADLSDTLRLFIAVGLCGGFTTFSTFSVETLTLLQQGQSGRAAFYIGLSVGGSLLAAAAGFASRG